MFCGSEEKERTRFRKEKKEKSFIAAKSELVGMKEYHVKKMLPYLKCIQVGNFLLEFLSKILTDLKTNFSKLSFL